MEVPLPDDLEGRLADAAQRRGVAPETFAREAIERAVDYDAWFIREVEKGLGQIERGQTLSHDDVGSRLERRLADIPRP